MDRLLSDDTLIPITVVGILTMEFANQDWLTDTLEGDVLDDEVEWASLAKYLNVEKGVSKLYKAQEDDVRHLKPLYVKTMI